MNNVAIVDFEKRYHDDFRRLSYEWLEKYVSVEPEDEKILNDPWGAVLNPGGYIFMAKDGERAVGTVALLKVDGATFELAKLAVTEQYQGRKIGTALLAKCLQVAKEENARQLILYTNRRLVPAIELYKKFGFTEIPLSDSKYIEADMKMAVGFA